MTPRPDMAMSARRAVTALAVACAIAALCARALAAVPVADYQNRVWQAIDVADTVFSGDTSVPLTHVVELLPPHETVEVGDASVDVDNTWLTEAVSAYESSSDATLRGATLEGIVTRLYGMSSAIVELDKAPLHATAEDRDRLKKILEGPEFRPPAEDPLAAKLREWRRKIFEFLVQLLQKLFGGQQSSTYASGLRIVIVAVGGVALILLVRAVAQAAARRKPGRGRKKTKVVLGEEVDESTTSDDLVAAAQGLAAGGDFRGAIRKLFVALIYELDERSIVTLRSEATNREYLALVRGLGRLHPVMSSMTDVFERVWYGEGDAGRTTFYEFQQMHAQARTAIAAPAAN